MAYINFKPSDYFNTTLFNGAAGAQSVTGVGFQPDFVWGKSILVSNHHQLLDAVRGVGKPLESNSDDPEHNDPASSLSSFDSDGFTLAGGSAFNPSGTNNVISWNWKAGTTSGLSGGTITPSGYSINTTAGFGIYKWSGTGSAGTIAHGLGKTPKMILLKRLDSTYSWFGYFDKLGSSKNLSLNLTNAAGNAGSSIWNSSGPSSTVFNLGTDDGVNLSGGTYIAYVWCNVKGYAHHSIYRGNGVADGVFVYTGFEPEAVLMKDHTGNGYNWQINDNKRSTSGGGNVLDKYIAPNTNAAQGDSGTSKDMDFYSNGFKFYGDGSEVNGNDVHYVFSAWAKQPIVGKGGNPGLAR